MTVILLGLLATLSAVIIVTVVRGGERQAVATIKETHQQIINLKTSSSLNLHTIMHQSPLTSQWPQSAMYSSNLSRVSTE